MMLRSLTVAALTLAGSGVACAQSVYLYVAPSASVYVTPTPNGYYNGAATVYEGPYPGPYAPPAPVVAAPLSPAYPAEIVPEAYVPRAPTYTPGYGGPLSAYGAAPGVVVQRRVYVEEPVRPPAPVPYRRWRGW
jgi:hypothetical protein